MESRIRDWMIKTKTGFSFLKKKNKTGTYLHRLKENFIKNAARICHMDPSTIYLTNMV